MYLRLLTISFLILAFATFSSAQAVPGSTVWAMPDGTSVRLQSEFWPKPCLIDKGKSAHPGLHDTYEELHLNWGLAVTPEGIREGVTAKDREFYTDGAIEKRVARTRATLEKYSPDEARALRLPKVVFFSLRCSVSDQEMIFVAGVQGTKAGHLPPEKIKPPLQVWILRMEEGKWRLDFSSTQHPIAKALMAGTFKEFGAPSDFRPLTADDLKIDSTADRKTGHVSTTQKR